MEESTKNFRDHLGDPEGYFPSALNLASMDRVYNIPFYYRKKKSNGQFTKKEFVMHVKMNYNPFTGEKL